jgi:hypothetical protein
MGNESKMKRFLAAALLLMLCVGSSAAQQPAPAANATDKGQLLLTIFFKHDQSKNLDEINEQLKRQKFYEKFPPKDVEVVSWYVMMGIGQVVTLRFPAERLREVNRAVEQSAWGGYRTEFYPTYDYKNVAIEQQKRMTGQ